MKPCFCQNNIDDVFFDNKSVNILQQADISIHSHGFQHLVDEKSFASCEVTHLLQDDCYKSANDKLRQAWF